MISGKGDAANAVRGSAMVMRDRKYVHGRGAGCDGPEAGANGDILQANELTYSAETPSLLLRGEY